MAGFFQASQLAQSKAPPSLLPRCGACGLFKTCSSPKMPVSGKGAKRILLLGEAPGEHEDQRGKHFIGKEGQLLERSLARFGVSMRQDCWLTNALICHPKDNIITDGSMVEWCRPNLLNTLNTLKPDVVIAMGSVAVESIIGHVWKEDTGGVMKWAGFRIPCQKPNVWICPVFHPSYVARSEKDRVVKKIWEDHLEAALELKGKPWKVKPNYISRIQLFYDPEEAKNFLQSIYKHGYEGAYAFDYETTTLKPEDGGEIVSASVAWEGPTGEVNACAFPWLFPASGALLELLDSPNPKVGHNIKFEEKWTRHTGNRVRNWTHDCMLWAHWADSRPGITSLKFQAFALLGAEAYDDHVKPLLRAKKGQRINQILEEVNLKDLLRYNALDSLLELELAAAQKTLFKKGRE